MEFRPEHDARNLKNLICIGAAEHKGPNDLRVLLGRYGRYGLNGPSTSSVPSFASTPVSLVLSHMACQASSLATQ